MSTPITIYGKTYHVKANPSPELDELARFVDTKIRALASTQSKTATIDLAILTAPEYRSGSFRGAGGSPEIKSQGWTFD